MKQANGTGGIIKLNGRRRKPYAVVKTIGWVQMFDDNGTPVGRPKQRRQYIGYYATRKEALRALVNLNDDVPAPAVDTPKTAPFQPYTPTFAQMWGTIRKLKYSTWSHSNVKNYDAGFSRSEPIHEKRIDTISYMDLQKLMNAYANEGKTKGSLKLYKSFLSMVFNEAIKMNYIKANPASLLTIKATKESEEKNALTAEQIRAIYASDCRTRDIAMILIYTGMRISELLKIKELHDGYIISGVKTEAGKRRIIPIHPQISEALQRFIKSKRLSYSSYQALLKEESAVYGFPFTLHECRHTFITLANEYGMDLTTIKKIVGHSTSDVTEDFYLHTRIQVLRREIMKIPMVKDL